VATFNGSNGNNNINGTNGDDTIFGNGGNDDLDGRGGADTVFGGTGNDDIEGGTGNDTLHGEADNDEIYGESGDDVITGGSGHDYLDGGDNNDNLDGGTGNDELYGGSGNDVAHGGDGNDEVHGGSGSDTLSGGADNDELDGGDQDDTLDGGSGNDILLGGNGNDHLTGGGGLDFIDGGSGFDTAYYSGSILEYDIYTLFGVLGVVHAGGAGADGADLLIRVERLVFADAVIDVGVNNAPIAFDDAAALDEDAGTYDSGTASVLDNDFDFEGDTLSVTPGSFAGTYGTLVLDADGTYTYTPFASTQTLAQGEIVQDSFSYTVSDGSLTDTGTLTFTISGLNDVPVANPDSAATAENAAVLIDVLANDDDVDNGAVLTVTSASAPAGQGSASVVGNQVEFDPGSDFDELAVGESEIVLISYSITDEFGATSSSTVSVTVTGTNDGPVANPDTDSTSENQAILVDVLANDEDVDNGAILTVVAASAPAGQGSASVVGNQVEFDPGSDFDDLAEGQTEIVVVSYTIEDEHGASDSSTITITVTGTNDGPVANPDSATTSENASVLIDVLANDDDADDGAVLTVTAASAPAGQGTATVVGNQVEFDPGTDFDELAVGESQVVVVSYTIEDEHGASDSSTVNVTVTGTNDGPVANPDTDTTSENVAIPIDVLANDIDVDNGATLTVTAASAPPGQGTATVVGNQVEFDPGSDFDYLAVGESAVVVLDYSIEDEHGASSSSTVSVTVTGTNDAPTIDAGGTDADGAVTELPNNDPNEDVFVHSDSGTIAFDDVDLSDTHSAGFTPQGGGYLGTFTLDPVNQAGDSVGWDFSVSDADLDFLDDGEILVQTYTVEIDDGNGGTVTQDVTITLTGAADGPQTEWYIDNSAVGSANTGTQADPFTSIAAFNAAQGTMDGPQVGHNIFLLAGTGTYAEADGINLLDDQTLIGVADGALRPTIVTTGAGNHGIELAQDNNVSGVDIGTTMGAGISDGGGTVGVLVVGDVGIGGVRAGQILDIDDGGLISVQLNEAASTASSGGAIDLDGVDGELTVSGVTTIAGVHGGGGVDVTGSSAIVSLAGGGLVSTGTSDAINFAGNTGALVIDGGLDIVTTGGAGLNATGGGTIVVTGGGNSVTSTTGVAVTISGTAIGAAGVTLESVSANGAASGIVLNGTGSTGFFTVTGDGSQTAGLYDRDGSGGTIQSTTGDGVSLTNAFNVTLRQMNLEASTGDAVESVGGGSIALSAVSIDTPGGYGWRATDLSGVNAVDNNSRIFNWQAINSNGVGVVNTNTNFTSFTVADSLFTTSATGADGFLFDANGTTSGAVSVLDSEFTLIDQDAVQINNDGSGTINATIQGSNFHDADATGGDGNNTLFLALTGSGILNFQIGGLGAGEGNSFDNLARVNANIGAIAVNAATVGQTGSRLNGWIEGNSITNIIGRDGISFGIESNGGTHGAHAIEVAGNTLNNIGLTGLRTTINSVAGGSITATNLSLIDNVMTNTGINPLASSDARSGIDIKTNWDNFASGGDMVTNLLLQDNVVTNNASSGLADTVEIVVRGGDAGTNHTANITLLGNDFTNSGGTSVVDIFTSSTTSGSGITLNLDMNSDNIPANANDTTNSGGAGGSIQLRNPLAGATYAIENLGADPPAAFVSARNNGDNVSVTGTIVSTGPVTMPTSPSSFIMLAPEAPLPCGLTLPDDAILGPGDLDLLIAAAIERWDDAGATAEQIAAMSAVSIVVSDMSGPLIGSATPGRIELDSDGAGHGWFIDATPGEDSEYQGSGTRLSAVAGGPAEGSIDALTVIMHELGHQVGLGDDHDAASGSGLMYGYVELGERRLPDGVFGAELDMTAALGAGWNDMVLAHPDTPMA
jgi:VCBS repeat-containing protein